MQLWVVLCWALLALAGAYQCPDGRPCEDGQTCCNHPDSGYECCPLDQAECCEDHIHCCPAATVCDITTSRCVNATVSMPWVERTSYSDPRLSKSFRMIKTYMGEDEDNICPDLSRCPPEFSCLKALTKFGCCPLAHGAPCSDGKHCCPEDHQCSEDSRSCIKKEPVSAVLCSDGKSECPYGTTCCESPEGKWGCCPMPKAVCCEDKLHCCPEGTTCDTEHSTCVSLSTKTVMPMWDKLPARIRAAWENQKGKQMIAEAADDSGSEKTTANPVPPSEEEVSESSVTKAAESSDVACNDSVACPDNHTCCRSEDGGWRCCPLPKAVCCKDHRHCCPNGRKCNMAKKTCDDDTSSLPMVKKIPAIPRLDASVGNVSCDRTSSCPDGTTCCKTKTGGWGCCPFPQAVCCKDLLHCCPKGKHCNLAKQTCEGDTGDLPWVEKLPAIPRLDVEAGNVACDSRSSCPDGTTCCKTKTGAWACCPLPKAVCCNDHEHCCPSGTTCDLTTLSCLRDSESSPITLKKCEVTTVAPTTVALSTQTEEMVDEKWEDEEEEEEENKNAQNRVRCNDHTSCPQDTTCCFMASSQKWGCCPLPHAVCCTDGSHCCPSQYRCDEQKTSCVKGEVVIPWYSKLQATTSADAPSGSEQCDDVNQCPEGTTCCRLTSGEWGCCPMQNAVCCPDQEHCCPQGYTCNMASKSCQKLNLETLLLTAVLPSKDQHQPSPSPLKSKNVQCDEKTYCQDRQTCCRTSATTWGCCPMPNAVCCSDMKHCCAAGYTCTDTGDCTRDARLHWFNWHMFRDNKKRALVF